MKFCIGKKVCFLSNFLCFSTMKFWINEETVVSGCLLSSIFFLSSLYHSLNSNCPTVFTLCSIYLDMMKNWYIIYSSIDFSYIALISCPQE